MSGSLPTPRHLLTSLFNSLPAPSPGSGPSTSNPLKNLSPEDRSLLITLHVSFPSPILLPALDLLDRQLVTRVIQTTSELQPAPGRQPGFRLPQAEVPAPQELDADVSGNDWRNGNYIYVVTSASDVRGRGTSGPGQGKYAGHGRGYGQVAGQTYVVRTRAWNCSCAAFTFSAFPASGSTFSATENVTESVSEFGRKVGKHDEMDEDIWEFGGMSNDGINGSTVPCCKHLLACVMVEKWEDVMGKYVIKRELGREEMAGIASGA